MRHITFISRENHISSRKNTLYKVRCYVRHAPQSQKTYDNRTHKVVTRQNSIFFLFFCHSLESVVRITWFIDSGGVLFSSVQYSSVQNLQSLKGGWKWRSVLRSSTQPKSLDSCSASPALPSQVRGTAVSLWRARRLCYDNCKNTDN